MAPVGPTKALPQASAKFHGKDRQEIPTFFCSVEPRIHMDKSLFFAEKTPENSKLYLFACVFWLVESYFRLIHISTRSTEQRS